MKRILACALGMAFAAFAAPAAALVPTVIDTQLECLALNIYWEARGESPAEQLAVGYVTVNRMAHAGFPDDVCSVVKQGGEDARGRCQFSWWCDGRDDTPRERAAWIAAVKNAKAVLNGTSEDPTDGALYFHHKRVKPRWASALERTRALGPHFFYR